MAAEATTTGLDMINLALTIYEEREHTIVQKKEKHTTSPHTRTFYLVLFCIFFVFRCELFHFLIDAFTLTNLPQFLTLATQN